MLSNSFKSEKKLGSFILFVELSHRKVSSWSVDNISNSQSDVCVSCSFLSCESKTEITTQQLK